MMKIMERERKRKERTGGLQWMSLKIEETSVEVLFIVISIILLLVYIT